MNLDSKRADLAFHLIGGAAIATVELAVTGSAVLALFWSLLVGFVRESEQQRAKRKELEAMLGHRIHPSDLRYWGGHKVAEMMQWLMGALTPVGFYALS